MNAPEHKAVFLSYASQDAEAAKRICDALRAAGVEVWFDQNELVGGDAWDAKIRKQIADCALFVPIISASTQARLEGYFRIEWKLAAQRTHAMADEKAFLLPVVIDSTRDADARVPVEFKSVQWTRVNGAEAAAAFCRRVRALLEGGGIAGGHSVATSPEGAPTPKPNGISWLRYSGAAIGLVFALVFATRPLWRGESSRDSKSAAAESLKNPSEAQRLVQQAKAMVDDDPLAVRESFRTAVDLCQRAISLDPGNAEAWATLSRANRQLRFLYNEGGGQRREEIRQQAERAMRLAPDSVESQLAMAIYERGLPGGVPAATARLEELWRRFPQDRRIARWLGNFSYLDNDAERTRLWAERADSLPGGDPVALNQIAWQAWLSGRLEDVEPALKRSFARGPSSSALHLNLLYLSAMGDLAGARAALETVPPSVMREDRVVGHACQIYLAARQPEKALEVLQFSTRELFEEGRFFAPRGQLAGEALLMAGKPRAADVEFRAALKSVEKRLAEEPRDGRLVMWRARLLLQLGEREEGARQCEIAVELGQRPEPAALVMLGRFDEALKEIDLRIDRTQLDWAGFLRSLNNPIFEPLRTDARFRRSVQRGEAWIAEVRSRIRPASTFDAPAGDGSAPADKSVAVLAFANLSSDKEQEYFSDGISEELLNVLAKVPGLKVSARTSAFFFKGKNTPIPEIAKQLGVAYVVEGSVRKAGDKVRITAQLIKAADGFHVWSETFTRDLKDIFAVQDEIAGLVAQSLSLKLGTSSSRKAAAVNPQSFEYYVQARQSWSLRTPEGFARAEQMLNRALELAPDFVRARAALIDVVQMRSLRERNVGTFGTRHAPEIEQRLVQVREVLAIDPELAEAYSTLGQTLDSKWLRDEAGRAYRRATELNPNYATGRQWYGMHLAELGYMDEALAELKAACDLDPFSFIILDNYGWLLNLADRRSEALQMLDRAAALNPGFDQTARVKAAALNALGRTAEAQAIARQLKNSQREMDVWTLGSVGLHAEAKALLTRLDPRDVSNRFQALLAAGEREAALEALSDPSGASKGDTIDMLYHPMFDPIRHEPRFVEYLSVLGLTEAHDRAQRWRAEQRAKR